MTAIKKELLARRVEKIYPNREALAELLKKRKIRLYLGIDPTGTRLHLGHTIPLRKLQEFADLGHEAILLIGTGTVLVGDPSQREKARERITEEKIQKNFTTWKQQAQKILDLSKIKIRSNGEWLLNLRLKEIIEIASHISAVQLFKREMFRKRLEQGGTVWTHETLYPLLQGYDSVVMDVDLEIGGTDQTFNMLIGRELQRKMNNREKFVLTVPMILGIDGKQMSKTSANCVWLTDSPKEMFGKLMSIPDEQIVPYLELLTDIPLPRIRELKDLPPIEQKKFLALEITRMYHGPKKARAAQGEFERVFQEGQLPKDLSEVKIKLKVLSLVDLLVKADFTESKSEARRLIEQGGVEVNRKKISDPETQITIKDGMIIKVGKRRFARVRK